VGGPCDRQHREATAAGNLWSEQAGKIAVLAKTTRNATIGFVVLGYALYWAAKGEAGTIENKAEFLWNKFPNSCSASHRLAGGDARRVLQGAGRRHRELSRWAFLLTSRASGFRPTSARCASRGSIHSWSARPARSASRS